MPRPLTVALAVTIAAAASLGAQARADTSGVTVTATATAAEFPAPSTGGTLPQIQGRVTDATGSGVQGEQVALAFTDADHPGATGDGTTTTAADGSYALQPSEPEPEQDGQLESRTYTVTVAGATSAPVHIGEPGDFAALVNSGGYATPGNPYAAIAGQVSGPAGSVILGQKLTAAGWQTVAQTTSYPVAGTAGVNRFSVAFPGLTAGSQTVRAVRLGDAFQDEVDSPAVSLSYTWSHLAGNRFRAAFAFHTVTNTPVRYSPCTPITWSINLAGAPAGALRLVQQAFVQAGYYSGYHFRYVGTTKERPSSRDAALRSASQTGPAILVKWVKATGETDLAKNLKVAGVGGSILQHLAAGKFRLGGGTMLLIQKPGGQDLPMDFSPYGWGPEVLHEIGSVMGLRNVPDQSEIMSIKAGVATRYGAGDAAGLAKLGKTLGCATS